MTGSLVYLIVYLIDPFITESHHSYRNSTEAKSDTNAANPGAAPISNV